MKDFVPPLSQPSRLAGLTNRLSMVSHEMTGLLTGALSAQEQVFLQHDQPRVVEPVPWTALNAPCTPLRKAAASNKPTSLMEPIIKYCKSRERRR